MVNISNNHIYDYLEMGFQETIKTLEKGDILYCGEGKTAFYETKGVTVACIGYTGWNTSNKKKISLDIKNAREKADLLILSFHWGAERSNYPDSTQKELGRFCIDEGADIVVGHHPHVIQGIEYYRGKYIVYSLGNFCFGGNRNPTDKDSFIFQNRFIFKDKKIEDSMARIIPCRISSVVNINDYQPVILENEEGWRVLGRIFTYSKNLEYGIEWNDNFLINVSDDK